MDEGERLVGRLCRLWDEHEDFRQYGYLIEFDPASKWPYQLSDEGSDKYTHAEAVEVTPVDMERRKGERRGVDHDHVGLVTADECHSDRRKPDTPTHEEIMSEWWEFNGKWSRVESYIPSTGEGRYSKYLILESWRPIDSFRDRKHAKVPPK